MRLNEIHLHKRLDYINRLYKFDLYNNRFICIIHKMIFNKLFHSSLLRTIMVFTGTCFMISAIQWMCIQFLAKWCHTSGLFGFLFNSITLGSPSCYFVNQVQLCLCNHYITIWSSAGIACITWTMSTHVSSHHV